MTVSGRTIEENYRPLELRLAVVGLWSINAHVLICPHSRRSVLIDPGGEPQTLHHMLKESDPAAILVTHSHPDHIGVLDEMRKALKVPVMAHAGADASRSPVSADIWLKDGDCTRIGVHQLRVYHAPGHADDQICLAIENDERIIVGDTIFKGGPGKTWSTGGFQKTLVTLRNVVLQWPDETICYPGHGVFFRLGDQRPLIERFIKTDHGPFYGDATWEM